MGKVFTCHSDRKNTESFVGVLEDRVDEGWRLGAIGYILYKELYHQKRIREASKNK
jgi:hypothetical protein